MAQKWIGAMHLKKGALHKDLGVPADKKIPSGKLSKAVQRTGVVGARARLAETFRKFKH